MAHELGRQYVAKNMPDVETSFMESVPEGADSERVINQLAAQGNKIIFTTSFGYMDPTINVAKNSRILPSCTAPVLKPRPTLAPTLAACMKRVT